MHKFIKPNFKEDNKAMSLRSFKKLQHDMIDVKFLPKQFSKFMAFSLNLNSINFLKHLKEQSKFKRWLNDYRARACKDRLKLLRAWVETKGNNFEHLLKNNLLYFCFLNTLL